MGCSRGSFLYSQWISLLVLNNSHFYVIQFAKVAVKYLKRLEFGVSFIKGFVREEVVPIGFTKR